MYQEELMWFPEHAYFFLSTTPFTSSDYEKHYCEVMALSFRKSMTSNFMYSPPESDKKILIQLLNETQHR